MGTILSNKIFKEINNNYSILDSSNIREQIDNYNKILFRPDQRTLLYNGYPYGTAYQFGNADTSGDVFGDVLSHSIKQNVKNVLLAGEGLIGSKYNSMVIGQYNDPEKHGSDSLFTIGCGDSSTHRNNILNITSNTSYLNGNSYTSGNITAYQISNTKLDTSYVTSLGKDATMNIVMEALLESSKYYPPTKSDFQYSTTNTTINYEIGEDYTGDTISLIWKNTKPYYDERCIAHYIQKYKKLPDGINLSNLSYTNFLGSFNVSEYAIDYSSITYSILQYSGDNYEYKGMKIKFPGRDIKDEDLENLDKCKIYGGETTQYSLSLQNNNIPAIKTLEAGIYKIMTGNAKQTIEYSCAQTSYFKQLFDKGVFVPSVSNKFTSGYIELTEPSKSIYVGIRGIVGVCVSDTNYSNSEQIWEKLLRPLQFDGKADKIGDNYTIHYMLHTDNSRVINDNITKEMHLTKNDFVSISKNKLNSGIFKYFYFALPTNYCNHNGNLYVWHIAPLNAQGYSNFVSSDTDKYNYIFKQNIIRNNIETEYTFFVGKTIGSFNDLSTNAQNQSGDSLAIKNVCVKPNGIYDETTDKRMPK